MMKNKFKIALRLGALLVGSMSDDAIATIRMEHHSIVASYSPLSVVHTAPVNNQLECLALNIYREAGGEPYEGKVAVAQVTMNRTANPAYPKDICSVVHQKTYVNNRAVCQFSWYCTRHRPVDELNYEMCREIARKVLYSGYRMHKFKDAMYFHTVAVKPRWRNGVDMIGRTGHHLFYRPKSSKTEILMADAN
jgi:spore germination cell wall hydrolase CwlJ-like protein